MSRECGYETPSQKFPRNVCVYVSLALGLDEALIQANRKENTRSTRGCEWAVVEDRQISKNRVNKGGGGGEWAFECAEEVVYADL